MRNEIEKKMSKIRFAMAIHNHQPIGNFEGVFEAAYQNSYLPFLEVIEEYPGIPFSLHTSGSLLEWLVGHHPEYVDRLHQLVQQGQTEILGGGYYEPILPMIPSRDRLVQIRGYSEYLRELFDTQVRGMWVAERVWEQNLVSDICKAGIEYTILDDYHFRKVGLEKEELFGYYSTEDEGNLLRIFPGSEPMRYMIPFQEVDQVIEYLREVHQRHQEALVVFADDGEKFGSWPGTKAHVYEHGWLRRLLEALGENRDWLEICTLSQALDALEPAGEIYLSDCSYREMTEWALPSDRQVEYERLTKALDHVPEGGLIKEFLKGGFWRNFKVKYPETREMYARMMEVSSHLERLCREVPEAMGDHRVHRGREALYRGQCNCPYWHGSFGGLYLPHLRNAVYSQLIEAEKFFDLFENGSLVGLLDAKIEDLDFDGRQEVRMENEYLVIYFRPAIGGHLYELDLRDVSINLGASLTRRPEAYHEKVRQASQTGNDDVGSIHDRILFKQEGLDKKLFYDSYPRKSLVDHFFVNSTSPQDLQACTTHEIGDFVTGKYHPSLSWTDKKVSLTLTRTGHIGDHPLTLTKRITLLQGGRGIDIHYLLEELPNEDLRFGIELNFAALAANVEDRYFHELDSVNDPGVSDEGRSRKLGWLGTILDLANVTGIGLADEWLGIDISLRMSLPGGLWTVPIQIVSQSEGGFELVHQSVCVLPHWQIPAASNSWEVDLSLEFQTISVQSPTLAKVR